MADVIAIWRALGAACTAMLSDEECPALDAAIDEAAKVFRYYKGIAGDAGAKNPILQAIYKGA
jgi:ABC-type dipeptide/oligopeptide/nickel transport system ATPase subunit